MLNGSPKLVLWWRASRLEHNFHWLILWSRKELPLPNVRSLTCRTNRIEMFFASYCTWRPDISIAVFLLRKPENNPAQRPWRPLQHVVRCIKGTNNYGLQFPNWDWKEDLLVHGDADWGRDLDKCYFRTDYVIYFKCAPFLWKSKWPSAPFTSSCEAAFAALSDNVKDVVWMWQLLPDTSISPNGLTRVYQENLGAISWNSYMIGLRKMKHVQITFIHVCDQVENVQYSWTAFHLVIQGRLIDKIYSW